MFSRKKVWLVIGDSISEHNFRVESGRNYDYWVSKWLHCEVINVAASSTGFIKSEGKIKGWVERIEDFPKKVDFITVMGALNDRSFEVGEFKDTDCTTLYGALHTFFQNMIKKYPCVPIGVITSTPRKYCYGEDGIYVEHVNAVIRVAQHYSLPVLDLYRSSGVRPWNTKNSKEFFSCKKAPRGDGVHLNEKGQKLISKKIYYFIRTNLF